MNPSKWLNERLMRQATGEGTPAADATPVTPAAPVQDAAPDLSFIPADFVADGKPDLGKFSEHYKQLAEAAATKPEVPEAYDFALPSDLKFDIPDLPADFKMALDPESEAMKPLFGELTGILKEVGAPKEAGSKLMGVLAKYEAHRVAAGEAHIKADLAKLGDAAKVSQRQATLSRALETKLPADEAAVLKEMIGFSGGAIRALERLISTPTTTATPAPVIPSVEADLAHYYANPKK